MKQLKEDWVRPKDLDIDWARSKILPSTRDLDLLKGFRHIVARNGGLYIAEISRLYS